MVFGPQGVSLREGMRGTDMNYHQLWLNYVSVSGSAGPLEVEAYVLGLLTPDAHEHDLIAQAVNEWYIDRGRNHPVGYWHHTELT